MAYYWRCKKHNEVMFERLDETGTKIIPYCGMCACNKELQQIIANQDREFQKEYVRAHKEYQEEIEKYQRELLRPSFLKKLPLFLLGLAFIGMGAYLLNVYPDNEPVILLSGSIRIYGKYAKLLKLIGGILEIILGGSVVLGAYNSKPIEPKKPEVKRPQVPYITTIYNERVEQFNALQAEVDQYKVKLKAQYDRETISTHEMNEIDLELT